jgi:hypothetical protein
MLVTIEPPSLNSCATLRASAMMHGSSLSSLLLTSAARAREQGGGYGKVKKE